MSRRGSFGIVGESGSGKSTILRAMAGLNEQWGGRIAFDGKDVAQKRTPTFSVRCKWFFRIRLDRCIHVRLLIAS